MNYLEVTNMCNDINMNEWAKFIENKTPINDFYIDSLLETYIPRIKSLLQSEDTNILLLDPNVFAIKDNCSGAICKCGSCNIIIKLKLLKSVNKETTIFLPQIDNFIHNSSLKDLPQIRVPIDVKMLENYKWTCIDCETLEWHDFGFNDDNRLVYII